MIVILKQKCMQPVYINMAAVLMVNGTGRTYTIALLSGVRVTVADANLSCEDFVREWIRHMQEER